MKTRITLLLVWLTGLSYSANAVSGISQLELSVFRGGTFAVWVDGRQHFSMNGQVTVNGLYPGTHQIRVIEQVSGRYGRVQSRRVLYQGSINIPYRSVVYATVTPESGLRIREITPLPAHPVRTEHPGDLRRGNRYGNRDRHQSGYYGHAGPNGGEAQLSSLLHTLETATFDQDRMLIATQYLESGSTTTAEVSRIMLAFRFEASRLEFAKKAWHYVIDPENYYLVNRSFQYSSSINALDRYIRSVRY